MYFYNQFSGMQNRYKSLIIFQIFLHKTTADTLRILSIMRTMQCGKLALMVLRNENNADGRLINL